VNTEMPHRARVDQLDHIMSRRKALCELMFIHEMTRDPNRPIDCAAVSRRSAGAR
jgi:hypothetical protein